MLNALVASPVGELASSKTPRSVAEEPPAPEPPRSQHSTGSQPPSQGGGATPPKQQQSLPAPPQAGAEPAIDAAAAPLLPEEMHGRWLQLLAVKKHALEQVQHMRTEALSALDSMRRTLVEATDRYVLS